MGSRLTLTVPADFLLKRDACSYGYFLLAPNYWEPESQTFHRTLTLASTPVRVSITQPKPRRGEPLVVRASRTLTQRERADAEHQIARMLRLDEDHATMREFHRVDPRWRKSGRGRLFRSPSLFEDVIKTVTSCNVQWPSTVVMNLRLCEVIGKPCNPEHAFPTPAQLAKTRAATLRARCRTGYRDARIVELARLFTSKRDLDVDALEDPATPDDVVRERLIELPGIGPYAAANIMQLMGRYSTLPLDTESIRHAKTVLGMKGPDRAILKRLHDHYTPFGTHAFRSYWFELWEFYEAKRGPAWTWARETTGRTFTAAQLKT